MVSAYLTLPGQSVIELAHAFTGWRTRRESPRDPRSLAGWKRGLVEENQLGAC